MPNPQFSEGSVDLSDAPTTISEESLDALFPNPEVTPQAPSAQATPAQPSAAPATPQAAPTSATPQEFIVQGKKSVYRSREAVERGINEKDDLIEKLRTRYSLATGIDPITGQAVGGASAPSQGDDYMSNPEKYVSDLYEASKVTDPKMAATRYRDTQLKLLMEGLAPFAPVLGGAARGQAIQQVVAELPDFNEVYNSQAFGETLERLPELKEALQATEQDLRYASRLPGLYKLAYFAARGAQLPELLKANGQPSPQATRPTTAPSTPTPPNVVETRPADLTTTEGRKAIIAEAERRGLASADWKGLI